MKLQRPKNDVILKKGQNGKPKIKNQGVKI